MTTDQSLRGSAGARTRTRAPARLRLYVPAAVAGMICLIVSLVLFSTARQIEQRRALEQFRLLAADRAHAVQTQIESELRALYILESFFQASKTVTREEFEAVVSRMRMWADTVQIVEWVPRIAHASRESFESAAQSRGFAEFSITEKDENGVLVPASERLEYFPVLYTGPRHGNEAAVGFDVASNPIRFAALQAARDSNLPIASAPDSLVQEAGEDLSVLIFLPVYRTHLRNTAADRNERSLEGFVLGVFRVNDLLKAALSQLDPTGVDVRLFDDSSRPAPQELARFNQAGTPGAPPTPADLETQNRYRSDLTFGAAGRQWRVSCVPTLTFPTLRFSWTSWGVLASGLLFTVALVAYLTSLAGKRLAEMALVRSEERSRLILDNALDAVITFDVHGVITAWEGFSETIFGWTREEAVGQLLSQAIIPERFRDAHEEWLRKFNERDEDALRDRRVQITAMNLDGREFPVDLALTVLTQGDTLEINAFIRDISDRVAAETSLRHAAERFRTLVEHAPEAMVVLDADTLLFNDVNSNAERLFKMSRDALLEVGPGELSPAFQPNGRESGPYARELVERTLNGEIPFFEWSHLDRDGNVIPCEVRLVRLPAENQRLLRGSITDISERKRVERHQRMLMRELDHRVKNNLSAVLALTEQSISTSTSLDEFQIAFSGRIHALARLHEALARANWEGAEIGAIARLTLGAFMSRNDSRVTLRGETTLLPARVSSPICMALHELTTNATKYGALSTASGQVHVDWRTRDDGALILEWKESRGPAVVQPLREGFGTTLIKGVVEYELRGEVKIEFVPDGLCCTLQIPHDVLIEIPRV